MIIKKLQSLIVIEILTLTATIVSGLSVVMFLFRLAGYANYLLLSEQGVISVLMFVVFFLPSILKITIPVSLLLAASIVFMRMAQDRELEAWMASGVSLWQFVKPPFFIGIFATFMTLFFSLFAEPFARQEWKKFKWLHARHSIEQMLENRIKAQTFANDLIRVGDLDFLFYTDKVFENSKEYGGLFLAIRKMDADFSLVFLAKKGALVKKLQGGIADYVFVLKEGSFYDPGEWIRQYGLARDPANKINWKIGKFSEIQFSLLSLFQRQLDLSGLETAEVRNLYPRQYLQTLMEQRKDKEWKKNLNFVRDHTFFYEQISLPLACLFLPVLGVCLGIADSRGQRQFSYVSIAVILFIYYALVMASQQLSRRAWCPPEISLVLPSLFLLVLVITVYRWRSKCPPGVSLWNFIRSKLGLIKEQQI